MTASNSVLEPIERGWRLLTDLVDSLGRRGLAIEGANGWTVQDHLFHISAWELSLVALLEGTDRASEMGAPGLDETDEINAAVWAANRGRTADQAVDESRAVHTRLLAALGKLSDADLHLSYNHYQPQDPMASPAGDRPVVDWVAGNTWEHYAEHIGWINQLIKESSAAR